MWRPISEAPQQTRLWVGREDLAGWFADAVYRPSVGWCYADDRAGPEARLKYEPTHYMDLPSPPPRKVVSLKTVQKIPVLSSSPGGVEVAVKMPPRSLL